MTDQNHKADPAPEAGANPAIVPSQITETSAAARPRRPRPTRFPCVICGKEKPARDVSRLDVVRPSLLDRIRADHPDLPAEGFVCLQDLDRFRSRYVTDLLGQERGELTRLEQEVVQSLADHETLAENIETEFSGQRTFGERLSDHLASFGGSWTFIMIFAGVLIVWMRSTPLRLPAASSIPIPSSCSIWCCHASRLCRRRSS
ncbi:MAG TPA: hypothetical protein VFX37_08475 [Pseudolabrys sp.]|nr:hypothetical protein [Pseudolabrys sp.]